MSDAPSNEELKFHLAQIKVFSAEMQNHLDEARKLRAAVEDQLGATEAARKKADDHATYAFQAKENTERHAKSVSSFKGEIEAHVSAIANNRKVYDELVANATIAKATLDSDVAKVAEFKRGVESSAAQVAQLAAAQIVESNKIADAKVAVELCRAEIDKLKDSAQITQTLATEETAMITRLATRAGESADKVNGYHGTCTHQTAEISDLLKEAKEGGAALSAIIKRLEVNDDSATTHEARVKKLGDKLKELNDTAEALLPGATSAGLASSFKSQRSRFDKPQQRWLKVFIWCIVGLVVVALPSFLSAILGVNAADGWEIVLKGMVVRAPIVIPLVWLAVYAGRNYMLSIRIEEEYAYKEAISMAFEGYKNQMEAIGASDPKSPTPLNALCMNVLAAIAERPGRIYEGKQSKVSLGDEIGGLHSAINELRNKGVA